MKQTTKIVTQAMMAQPPGDYAERYIGLMRLSGYWLQYYRTTDR